jgi:hypothetical protein
MLLSLLSLIVWAASGAGLHALGAQSPADTTKRVNYAYRYRILGVYDEQSGDPLEGVEVADVLNGNKALTTKTGTVSLMFLPDGGGFVRLRKIGYEVQTITVSISPADTNPLTVVLARATQLATVVVKDSAPKYISPGLRAFEARRKAGMGHFIAEEEMRKNEGHTLGDVIAMRMPGLMAVAGRGNAKFLVSTRKRCAGATLSNCSAPNCFVTVYENGVKIYDVTTSDRTLIPDVERMSARDYAAAEFYAGGEVPPEYNGTGSGCGVLLLWTRER